MTELTRMAAQDPSSLVRLVLASTMQRMPFGSRPAIAASLVARKEGMYFATAKNFRVLGG
jgi:hypothetical protein